jgi:hypothetical protein
MVINVVTRVSAQEIWRSVANWLGCEVGRGGILFITAIFPAPAATFPVGTVPPTVVEVVTATGEI